MSVIIGDPSPEFMARRFVVEAGSYDCCESGLEENCKYATNEMDYFTAKAHARALTGYCWKRLVEVAAGAAGGDEG